MNCGVPRQGQLRASLMVAQHEKARHSSANASVSRALTCLARVRLPPRIY